MDTVELESYLREYLSLCLCFSWLNSMLTRFLHFFAEYMAHMSAVERRAVFGEVSWQKGWEKGWSCLEWSFGGDSNEGEKDEWRRFRSAGGYWDCHVYPKKMKKKINYTITTPRHQKLITHHFTSVNYTVSMQCQRFYLVRWHQGPKPNNVHIIGWKR